MAQLVVGERVLRGRQASDPHPVPKLTVLPGDAHQRLNDGKCDPAGAFLVGSMALDDRRGSEVLSRFCPGGELVVLDGG